MINNSSEPSISFKTINQLIQNEKHFPSHKCFSITLWVTNLILEEGILLLVMRKHILNVLSMHTLTLLQLMSHST
jgi:hypothetical protein